MKENEVKSEKVQKNEENQRNDVIKNLCLKLFLMRITGYL